MSGNNFLEGSLEITKRLLQLMLDNPDAPIFPWVLIKADTNRYYKYEESKTIMFPTFSYVGIWYAKETDEGYEIREEKDLEPAEDGFTKCIALCYTVEDDNEVE